MQLVTLIYDIDTCAVRGQIHYQLKWAEHGNSGISPIGKGNRGRSGKQGKRGRSKDNIVKW